MKKKLLILTSLFLLMFTSGCVKQKDEYVITIDKNDNVTLSETVGIDKENLKMMNKEYGSFVGSFTNNANSHSKQFENYILDMTKKTRSLSGFDSQDYSDDEYVGFTQTKNNILISDIKPEYLMPGLISASRTPVTIDKGVFKDTYKIHLKYNYEKAYDEINERSEKVRQEAEGQNYTHAVKAKHTFIDNQDGTFTIKDTYSSENGFSGIGSKSDIPNPDITLTIKIPTKATKHNATKVLKNNEYQWDLFVLNSDVDINLEYTKQSNNMTKTMIVVSILLLLAVFGFIYIKNKDNISL